MDAYRFSSLPQESSEAGKSLAGLTCCSGPSGNGVRTEEEQQHLRVRFPLRSWDTCGKRHASFNRSLILGHMVYSYGGRWYQDSHKSHSAARAQAGLTNLNSIFQLNNLALPRGREAPDRALPSEASLLFSVWAQWLSADRDCPVRSEAEVCPLLTTGNNEKFLHGHQRN